MWAKYKQPKDGFTIVELLIVIVVIAILAAISVVAYNGIQDRARAAALSSSLRQAKIAVEAAKDVSGYPATMSTLGSSTDTNITYTKIGDGYCVEAEMTNQVGYKGFASSGGSSEPGPCPNGYWPLGGTNGNDSSAYDNDGMTHSGVSSSTDRSGDTNGATSYAASGHKTALSSPVGQAGQVTVSVWHKRDDSVASTTWRTLLGHPTANIHHLIINSSSRNIGIFDGSWRDFGYNVANTGEWQHFAVIYNSSAGNATLYVDGALHGSTTTSLNLDVNPIGNIGNWGGGSYWAGPVDDVSIYYRALSADEIAHLAKSK